MWFFILVIEAAVLAAILNTAWIGFTSSPLITTLHDTLYPVQNVPFPAISLCNNNRISRTAAVRYAEVLARKDPDGRNVSYFLEQVRLLGKLYDFDFENLHQMTQFQEFLDVHDISNASGIFSAFEALTKVRWSGAFKSIAIRITIMGRHWISSHQNQSLSYNIKCNLNI